MQILLAKIESEYRTAIQKELDSRNCFTPSKMIAFSLRLFRELKVENISDSEDDDSDMLLYQYGVYNWGDALGKHFSFDITRQFIEPTEDEPYQLELALIYEPESFLALDSYDCWSSDFDSLEIFQEHIMATDGFKLANTLVPKTYTLEFSQC